jgi:N-hydroxyarylamine O-acetyltransferase
MKANLAVAQERTRPAVARGGSNSDVHSNAIPRTTGANAGSPVVGPIRCCREDGTGGILPTMNELLDRLQLDTYLRRVHLERTPNTDLGGLRELHHAQFFTIPFENFDVLAGRGVDLDPDIVFDKLVGNRRGGYCFELNGLMLRVLRTLGFDARPLLARVHLNDPPSSRTHQLNLVRLGHDDWLMDVGFGAGGPRAPLPLREGSTDCGVAAFELRRQEPWGWMLRTSDAGRWKPSYSFDLSLVTQADIELGNHYTSTSPKTHFTRLATASLPTAGGRVSLRDDELTVIEGSRETTRRIDPEAYLEVLESTFGIELPELPRTVG